MLELIGLVYTLKKINDETWHSDAPVKPKAKWDEEVVFDKKTNSYHVENIYTRKNWEGKTLDEEVKDTIMFYKSCGIPKSECIETDSWGRRIDYSQYDEDGNRIKTLEQVYRDSWDCLWKIYDITHNATKLLRRKRMRRLVMRTKGLKKFISIWNYLKFLWDDKVHKERLEDEYEEIRKNYGWRGFSSGKIRENNPRKCKMKRKVK